MSYAAHAPTSSGRFGDGRRGVGVADAHVADAVVEELAKGGREQARCGRRAKTEAGASETS